MTVTRRTKAALAAAAVAAALAACPASAAEKDLSRGGKILLIGDSIFDCGPRGKRIEDFMPGMLSKLKPGARFEVVNLARGGMWIGPADSSKARGVSKPLLDSETSGWYFEVRKRCPKADAVCIMFGANDSKVYPPEVLRQKYEKLVDRLQKDYPGAKIVPATGIWHDPKHSWRYWRTPSMVKGFKQGDNRNAYLEPFFKAVRALAEKRELAVADVWTRMQNETAAGNWDLRMRKDGTDDDSKDAARGSERGWFGNIHPNSAGRKVIADAVAKTLLGLDGTKAAGAPGAPAR